MIADEEFVAQSKDTAAGDDAGTASYCVTVSCVPLRQ
jgi:hypothetical protein